MRQDMLVAGGAGRWAVRRGLIAYCRVCWGKERKLVPLHPYKYPGAFRCAILESCYWTPVYTEWQKKHAKQPPVAMSSWVNAWDPWLYWQNSSIASGARASRAEEFTAILRGRKEEFPRGRTIFRNPLWPQFDAQTVHEVTLVLSGAAATLRPKTLEKAIEKTLDLIAGRRGAEPEGR